MDTEGKIALLSNGEHSLFPGGGVDEGETFEKAFIRECKEEIGCDIEIVSHIGDALQFRAKNKTKYDVHFYLGRVVGEKGTSTTTEAGELACTISWHTPDEVLKVLKEQMSTIREDDYPAHFNCPTHLVVFKKYLELDTENN
jgi:8-oxo-dGTP pyrophosphatase MutT (NUDIX family)